MIKSIQQFYEKDILNLKKIVEKFASNPMNQADFVYGITDCVVGLGQNLIAEMLESMDESIREDCHRRLKWHIVRRDETTLQTSLGVVKYKKTLFKNKKTGESSYLLDKVMGLDSHVRMTEDAEARILEEALESSYRKGGNNVSINGKDSVSKQTVMNKVRSLRFDIKESVLVEKKEAEYLYIDADEDHVALQYLEKKGDIKRGQNHTIMPKMIYVYEGVQCVSKGRNELIGKRTFGGVYEGSKGVEQLWSEVYEYIEEHYKVDKIKKIYINGDGANWIKSGRKQIAGARFVLDRYHMHKYIVAATAHLLDSVEDARNELYHAINKKAKWMAENTFEKILSVTESESKHKSVENAKNYILGNWDGIMQGVRNRNIVKGCHAEGNVSHIYADRMSSRPLGWSAEGADKMARLRVYHENGGNVLELVRWQKEPLKQVVGAEKQIYSPGELIQSERSKFGELGKYVNAMTHDIPYPQVKKIAKFKGHIWGL